MIRVIKNSLLTTVLLNTLILTSLQVSAEVNAKVEKSFSVMSKSHFSLNNINGAVTIDSWSEQSIKVVATINAPSKESRDGVTISMQQNGQKVSVSTEYKEQVYRQNKQTAKVYYQVWLPADANLAGIEIVNGNLVINNITGNIEAEVVNGSIKANGLIGNSDLSLVNGNMDIAYQDHNVSLDNIELATVNGRIKLFLPESINATLNADTMYGNIKTDFGLTAKKNDFFGSNVRGEIGSGESQVNIESVNGSIKVLKSE